MAYVTNLHQYKSIETHWIALSINDYNATYFDSLLIEHIPKEAEKLIGNKNITSNFYRKQAYHSIMCRYFCTGIIDFLLISKRLLDYTNFYSSSKYKIIIK